MAVIATQMLSTTARPSSEMVELAYAGLAPTTIHMGGYDDELRSAIRRGLRLSGNTDRVLTKADARDLRLYIAHHRGHLTSVRDLRAAEIKVGVRDGQGNLLGDWR
jgi:hypothetical protein